MDILKDVFSGVGNVAGTAIKGAGDIFGGVAKNVYDASVFGRRQKKNEEIESLLKSEKGRRLLQKSQIAMNEARAAAMDRGEGLYGGRGVDPYVKGAEDLGKIQKARDSFLTIDEKGKAVYGLTPETATYFDAAEQSVLDRMKSTPRDNRVQDETDVFKTLGKRGKSEDRISRQIQNFLTPGGVDAVTMAAPTTGDRPVTFDNRDFFGGEQEVFEKMGAPRLTDYFQAPTETVPESNIPKTYPQLGIESIDDQATLEEMQKAVPDVDMREEYESDPELMKKLMELWRQKKLNRSNLHKAFSKIQQSAQQALGIR